MRICNKCNIEKNELDFSFKNSLLQRRSTICKECQKEYKLKHYYNNKQAHYDRNTKTTDKIKLYVLDFKSVNPCIKCGESEPSCLDFHHIDPRSKIMEVSKLRFCGSIIKVKEEMNKCIILCANCHRKLHAGIISL